MAKVGHLIKRDTDFISLNMNKNALIKAMRYYGLTASKVIKPIADGLEATKIVVHNAHNPDDSWTDEIPDHATRIKAAQIAIELLGLKNNLKGDDLKDRTAKTISKALKNGDEIELQRVIFNKGSREVGNKVVGSK